MRRCASGTSAKHDLFGIKIHDFFFHEELLLKSEGLQKTDNHLIYIGHQMMYTPEEIDEKLEKLRGVIYAEAPEVRECVLSLIQEPADRMYDEIPTGEEQETVTV